MNYQGVCRIAVNGIPSNSWRVLANCRCDELHDPGDDGPPPICLFWGGERAKIDGDVRVGSAFEGRTRDATAVLEDVDGMNTTI